MTGIVHINVTLGRVRATIFAVQRQWLLHIRRVTLLP